MPRYTTLTDFVNTQIEKFDIPDTEKIGTNLELSSRESFKGSDTGTLPKKK